MVRTGSTIRTCQSHQPSIDPHRRVFWRGDLQLCPVGRRLLRWRRHLVAGSCSLGVFDSKITRYQDGQLFKRQSHPLGLYLNVFITKNMSTSLNCDKRAPPRPLAQIFNGGQRRINQPGPRRVHDDGAGDDSHLLTTMTTYCQRSRLLIIECMKSEKRSANTLKGWLQKRNSHAPFSPLPVF